MLVLILVAGLAACSKDKPQQQQTNMPQPSSMTPGTQSTPNTMVPPPSVAATASGEMMSLAGVSFRLPAGWIKEASSGMRLAQYRLPGDDGPGRMVVFAFGPGQGGGTQANIDRWVAQFSGGSDAAKPEVNKLEQNGLTLSMVKTSGTYTPIAMGPMVPADPPQSNQALFGIIVEGGPQGTLFIKVTGPAATIQSHGDALEASARSASLSSAKG